jgi:DNA-binding MarR family transcriptional regulator
MDQQTEQTGLAPGPSSNSPPAQILQERVGGQPPHIDLDNYIPAFLTFLANKWARSASHLYLKRFGIGIEAWRIVVLLAIEGRMSSQRICQVIGMDKASVSRNLKQMQRMKLAEVEIAPEDARQRFARLTQDGFALHDRMLPLVLEREQRLLSCLSQDERKVLRDMLRRLHANLPALDNPKDYEF